ncbi:MAG TPA: PAS domain S-box protein [Alphaproteobacteria bacterium]|nr:PAS domain S-box protein [Alphaproteobacteria bacterium]
MSALPHLAAFGTLLAESRHPAVVYAGADGLIAFWNRGAEAVFGHSAADALGKRLDLIVPEEYRALHWTGFDRTIGSHWRGSTAWGPVPGLHRNGEQVALEVFLVPFRGEDERVEAVMALFRPSSDGTN